MQLDKNKKVENDVKTKLGMRIIKTGIAIYLSLLICNMLGFENGSLAAITAVVGLQPSIMGSLNTIKNQILATIIGCSIAIIITYFFPGYGLPIALAAIITIWICIRLEWQDSITLAVVTLILIAENTSGDYLTAISNRVIMIGIGLSVAFLLNLILPPRHVFRLRCKVEELRKAFEDFYIKTVDDLIIGIPMDKEELENHRQNIKGLLEESWTIYDLAVDSNLKYIQTERKDFKHIFRKVINSIENNLERSMEIHYSIAAILAIDHHQEINEKIHNYLHQIYIYHQEAFQYILADTEEYGFTDKDFSQIKQQLIAMIVPLTNSCGYFEPFNYYTILMEGERVVNEVKFLVEEKRKSDKKSEGR